jgi:hypothetical protein
MGKCFDPLGFLLPLSNRWKILNQDILRECPSMSWDDLIPDHFLPDVAEIMEKFMVATETKWPRSTAPADPLLWMPKVVSAGDAGGRMTGTLHFMVWIPRPEVNKKKKNIVQFLFARSKMLSIGSSATIPGLELVASLLATRGNEVLVDFFRESFGSKLEVTRELHSDASVVLALLRRETGMDNPWVAHIRDAPGRKVLEICGTLKQEEIRYVPTKFQVADPITKPLDGKEYESCLSPDYTGKGSWMEGPYDAWPTLANTMELSKVSVKDLQKGFGYNESIGLRGKLTRLPGGGVERIVATTMTGGMHTDDMMQFEKCTVQMPSHHIQDIQPTVAENKEVSALLTDCHPGWRKVDGKSIKMKQYDAAPLSWHQVER